MSNSVVKVVVEAKLLLIILAIKKFIVYDTTIVQIKYYMYQVLKYFTNKLKKMSWQIN